MAKKKIETIIKHKISPYELSGIGISKINQLKEKYDYDFLLECIEIGVINYLRYDENDCVIKESVETFLNKLPGIAYNRAKSPIEQEINHIKNKGKNKYSYWDDYYAEDLIRLYIHELENHNYTEEMIIKDLCGDFRRMMNSSSSWAEWKRRLNSWIDDIRNWNSEQTISQKGSIIPNSISQDLSSNIKNICFQINASYENNLFDCCVVMMRKLVETMLILTYQKFEIEDEIMINERHVSLDKIIQNAKSNKKISLSISTKKDLDIFKNLGNYSAHKIWYSCTKEDVEPFTFKYRMIVEELLYKCGLK